MFQFIFAFFAALSLSACSGSGSGGDSSQREPKTYGFPTQSCVYGLLEGQSADVSQLQQKTVEHASFDKPYNAALFRAVAKSNIPSTIELISKTAAVVYQADAAPTQECSVDLFSSLPTLPSDLRSKWMSAAPEDAQSILLGLYLPMNSRPDNDLPSVSNHAAIIVRKNTNRWTLVHEFMHHLFMLESVERGYNEKVAFAKYKETIENVKAIENDATLSNSQKIEKHVLNYVELVAAFDSQLIHFTLEEMTIEKAMKEASSSRKLLYAPESSNWYIHSSAEKARETWNHVKELGYELIQYANSEPGHDAAAAKVREMNSFIDSRLNEISRIDYAYPVLGQMDHALSLQLGLELHVGCSHDQKADEILKDSQDLLLF